MSCIGWVQAGEVWALHVPFFHVCQKSACCSCICRGWPVQFAIRFWLFFGFPFLYGLLYLGTGPYLTVGFAFLQPILFLATPSCHTTLSFLLLGMATGRVQARFFHIRTRPAGQDPWPRPGPFTKQIFFLRPEPASTRPRKLHGPHWAVVLQGPFCGPIKKKMFAISRLAFVNSLIRSPSYFSIYFVTFSRTKSLFFSIVLSFYSFSLFLLLLEEDEEAFWDPVGLFIKWRSHFFLWRKPFVFHYNIFQHQKQKQELTYKP